MIGRLKGGGLVGNPLELRITVGVVGGPLYDFPVGWEAVSRLVQQFTHLVGTDRMALRAEFRCQLLSTLAGPPECRFGIPG